MKKIALISAIAISILLCNNKTSAQIRVHLGLNFGARPVVYAAAPVQAEYSEPANYDGDEDYYYLPEVDAYYSIPGQCYYYNNGRGWVSAAYLPGAYRNYDWHAGRRYEVHAPTPYLHADYYRARYQGAALNNRWEGSYSRTYASEYHYNQDRQRNDNQRFDNMNRSDYNHQTDQFREQNRDYDRRGAEQHFDHNNPQRGGRQNDDRRPARF
jgi:hypothetical protein